MNNLMGILAMILASIGVVSIVLFMFFLGALFTGWILMLIFGAIGHIFGTEELFISYWQGVLLAVCLRVLFLILEN